jgi:hypothetical protein
LKPLVRHHGRVSGIRQGYAAHGDRVYDWTAIALDPAGLPHGWGHRLLVRQQTSPTDGRAVVERAY